MVIAVPAASANKEGLIDTRFGRAPYFLLKNSDGTIEFCRNTQNLQAAQGAGIQSAQNILSHGANVVLTRHCGPKAFKVLSAGGVKVYGLPENVLLEDAIKAFEEGKLAPLSGADVEGHWV